MIILSLFADFIEVLNEKEKKTEQTGIKTVMTGQDLSQKNRASHRETGPLTDRLGLS